MQEPYSRSGDSVSSRLDHRLQTILAALARLPLNCDRFHSDLPRTANFLPPHPPNQCSTSQSTDLRHQVLAKTGNGHVRKGEGNVERRAHSRRGLVRESNHLRLMFPLPVPIMSAKVRVRVRVRVKARAKVRAKCLLQEHTSSVSGFQ